MVLPIEVRSVVVMVVVLVAWEIVKRLLDRLFSRTIDSKYVTEDVCLLTRNDCFTARAYTSKNIHKHLGEVGRSIDQLRGIVLVLAVKAGVDQKTLQDLAGRGGNNGGNGV